MSTGMFRAFGMFMAVASPLVFAGAPAVAQSASDAEPTETVWFEGEDAIYAAGRYLNDALDYTYEYNAGRLAVQWVPQYEDSLFIRLRLAPQEGHQVVFEKGDTKPVADIDGGRCADFMLRIERFEAEVLKAYLDNGQRGSLVVDRGDEADGRICVRGDGAVGVSLREVLPDRDLGGRSAHAFLDDGRGYLGGL